MGNIIRRHVRRPADARDDDHELVPGEGEEEAAPSHILGPHALAHSHSNLLLPSLRHRYLGAGHSQQSLVNLLSIECDIILREVSLAALSQFCLSHPLR